MALSGSCSCACSCACSSTCSSTGSRSPSTPVDAAVSELSANVRACFPSATEMYTGYVSGRQMTVPFAYDPDAYHPDLPNSQPSPPQPYDPATYATWGRGHFGEQWHQLRQTMLRERNIYATIDEVYERRQDDLRIIEHVVEGRPFKPSFLSGGLEHAGWKRLWSRLSRILPRVQPPILQPPEEPEAPPTDPWKLLEYNRLRCPTWSEEYYQFQRIFLKESLIDAARSELENEPGDKRRAQEWNELKFFPKYIPGEWERRLNEWEGRAKGWTREQIDAEEARLARISPEYTDWLARMRSYEPRDITDRRKRRLSNQGEVSSPGGTLENGEGSDSRRPSDEGFHDDADWQLMSLSDEGQDDFDPATDSDNMEHADSDNHEHDEDDEDDDNDDGDDCENDSDNDNDNEEETYNMESRQARTEHNMDDDAVGAVSYVEGSPPPPLPSRRATRGNCSTHKILRGGIKKVKSKPSKCPLSQDPASNTAHSSLCLRGPLGFVGNHDKAAEVGKITG